MANQIQILDSPFFDIDVVLASKTYNLMMKFNTSDDAWYLTIRDSGKKVLAESLKLMPNQNITYPINHLNIFSDGDLWCLRLKNDNSSLGRDNLGIGKTYSLMWISSQDAIQEGIEGVLQL